jgi:1-deoxy-D-xylulose-5-phosphate reductoisomerase
VKNISILGATGSIGSSALKLISMYKERFNIIALTANSDYKKLAFYAKTYKSKYAVIGDITKYNNLKKELLGSNTICLAGINAINDISKIKTDILISAIVGIAGLKPTYNAIGNTKVLAIANKESIVSAGSILLKRAKLKQTKVIPIDSEHNAIFQVLENQDKGNVKDIIITASGGPFWNKDINSFKKISIKDALNHPSWRMGKKITIDSATMINKVLETIEASILFNIKLDKVKILIHPLSTIHGIVNYIDGTSHLVANKPDMKIAISYSLFWPYRACTKINNIDFRKCNNLNFHKPDKKKFPALTIKEDFVNSSFMKSNSIVLNAANEIAVKYFLDKKIDFLDIVKNIKKTIKLFNHIEIKSIEDVIRVNKEARNLTDNIINKKKKWNI